MKEPTVQPAASDPKGLVRQRVWDLLEQQRFTEPNVHGHIPAFVGSDEAAARLAAHPAWHDATTIKVNPDRAQLPVRVRALEAGKVVYMAVPNLASIQPFYYLDPANLAVPPAQAAIHQVAATFAPTVAIADMPPIDLIVCGSVAVDPAGARIGKGAGYSDIEIALLVEAGLVGARTMVATTVHQAQVVDDPLPETSHDFRVDLIATPLAVMTCPRGRRPTGVVWEHLAEEKINSIPALALHPDRPRDGKVDNPP
jgi:5-formyltetrahydrofolate cyclo-ligase